MRNAFKLEVAQHPICLRLSDPNFFDHIAQSYRGFPSDREPKLLIEVNIVDKIPPPASPGGSVISEGRGFRISFTSFWGDVDLDGGKGNLYSTPEMLTLALKVLLRMAFVFLLLHGDGLVLHALGVLRDKEAYVFFGPSGSGKTTAAKLSEGYTILSDDLVFLRPEDGSYCVHPTPAWGYMQKGEWENRPYPVKAVFKLLKSQRIEVKRCSQLRAILDVITFPPTPTDVIGPDRLLARFSHLVKRVPFFELHFVKDRSFWPWIDANLPKIGTKNANRNAKRGSKHGRQKTH